MLAVTSAAQMRDTCGTNPGYVCREILDRTGSRTLAAIVDAISGAPLAIVLILAGAWLVNRFAGRAIERGLRTLSSGMVHERMGAMRRRTPGVPSEQPAMSRRGEARINALTSILRSVAGFVIALLACFMVLDQVGVDIGPLLAGAGVLGVALGFGSQSLVKDFLSGMFILAEDQFGVGDVVDLDGTTTGTVEAVSLRTTRLRSPDGTVWHVPNGAIVRVGNKSQEQAETLPDVDKEVVRDVAADVAPGTDAANRDLANVAETETTTSPAAVDGD